MDGRGMYMGCRNGNVSLKRGFTSGFKTGHLGKHFLIISNIGVARGEG